jgi:methylphosphotriester-DNA--protein-cysteine methyltransferase
MSDGPSTRDHRITYADFRPCLRCRARSQAPFCVYTQRAITDRTEGTFARLRYSLGGDRPSQTTHLSRSSTVLPSE